MPRWFEVKNIADLPSPALVVYQGRVEENIRRMLAISRGPALLRPHIKTHKMREVIRLQLGCGITRLKCATIAEAEMAAGTGVADLLLAYQPVGPNVQRVIQLLRKFPGTKFSIICDDATAIQQVSTAMQSTFGFSPNRSDAGPRLGVFLDLNVGQHRTGVCPDSTARELYLLVAGLPGLTLAGLHAYDGHLSNSDPAERARLCEAAFAPVAALKKELVEAGLPVPTVVAGGTPTFPIHAARQDVECSPGTCVFWDAGYAAKLPDLDFLHAALVLTRISSKPAPNRICLDLGHKAIASENPPPRVRLFGLEEARQVMHSEEHLVLETDLAPKLKVGDALYGIPSHICPTVALYSEAVVVRDGQTAETWPITRERRLTV
jgi:D-serine deaminase-like pyridoxal phosphate-dependent protein